MPTYTDVDLAYAELVLDVLNNGVRKENRTGVDTMGLFGKNYSIDCSHSFPLLTSKEISWKNILLENLWFLSGARTVEFLHHYGVKFWDPWVDDYGEVPSAYGYEWRHFDGKSKNDQIQKALHLLNTNPNSRRIVVSAWNPYTAPDSKLPPCHMTWVLNVLNKKLNLALFQRSCDIALGVPYNIAGYAFLLYLFAHLTGLKVGLFNHTLVDAHIYASGDCDHREGLKTQLARPGRYKPTFTISPDIKTFEDVLQVIKDKPPIIELLQLFKLENYNPHPAINYKVAV